VPWSPQCLSKLLDVLNLGPPASFVGHCARKLDSPGGPPRSDEWRHPPAVGPIQALKLPPVPPRPLSSSLPHRRQRLYMPPSSVCSTCQSCRMFSLHRRAWIIAASIQNRSALTSNDELRAVLRERQLRPVSPPESRLLPWIGSAATPTPSGRAARSDHRPGRLPRRETRIGHGRRGPPPSRPPSTHPPMTRTTTSPATRQPKPSSRMSPATRPSGKSSSPEASKATPASASVYAPGFPSASSPSTVQGTAPAW
jgi:hypothetical protein